MGPSTGRQINGNSRDSSEGKDARNKGKQSVQVSLWLSLMKDCCSVAKRVHGHNLEFGISSKCFAILRENLLLDR